MQPPLLNHIGLLTSGIGLCILVALPYVSGQSLGGSGGLGKGVCRLGVPMHVPLCGNHVLQDPKRESMSPLKCVSVEQILEAQQSEVEEERRKKDVRRQMAIKTDDDMFV